MEIKSGKKVYEYRTRYQKIPTTVFVYISQTVKKITAIMEFDTPIIGTSEEISELAEKIKPGSYAGMREYLEKGIGYAIPVMKMIEMEPISLGELKKKFPNFVVPQSYYMWNNKKELLEYLFSAKNLKEIIFERKKK